ncbi:type-F conjugative transfer system pilin assembly protein TraF [Serratia plymuthica A30]|uniref:type-F conjugative transfer system pilin assembly protein TraF n=1 Tax=Serratia plymuthica TaxID=82996 RepID=UPI0002A45125|nr:type-F conjugative transfer system pilin assembly protein TraF [Serratia plymuthica]EKF67010.1 type-F conjugative transfer system pilin assembly protein TraF [Serratia plymuthica A30]
MTLRIIGMALLLISAVTHAEDMTSEAQPFTGWHWYNEPKETPKPKRKPAPAQQKQQIPDLNQLTPTEQAAVLKKLTMDAQVKAILYPSAENAATFLRWQKFWTDRASMFSQSFAAAQLQNPDLDYNLEHSHYNSTVPAQLAQDKAKQESAIQQLSQTFGMFFMYKGAEQLDSQMAAVVADFAKTRGLALIPISVDGVASPSLPGTMPNTGQVERMNVKYFPALFLIEPGKQTYKPLAYGFMTQDDLAKRFLNVATGFKPNF